MRFRPLSFLLLLLLIGCVGSEPIVSVDYLGSPNATLAIDEEHARANVVAQAENLKGFSVREARPSEVGWQLTVRLRLATERTADTDPKQVRRAVGAAAELRRLRAPEDESPRTYSAEVLEVRTMDRGAPSKAHVEEAIGDLMRRLNTSVRLWRANPEVLAEAIAGEDDHARAVAIQVSGSRKLVAVRPALEARLTSSTIAVQEVLRLTGALSEIADPASASAVIDAASRYPEATIPLVFALARLGGREAEAYLFTVQNGHERKEVRAAAAEALRGMRSAPEASSPVETEP